MRRRWVWRTVDAPADEVWRLLVDPALWPEWGPSVRSAVLDDGELGLGARGTVSTVVGVDLPFEITSWVEGCEWSWRVAGLPATGHRVEAIASDRCRVGFSVPWPAAPYLAVCIAALRRLDEIATAQVAATGAG